MSLRFIKSTNFMDIWFLLYSSITYNSFSWVIINVNETVYDGQYSALHDIHSLLLKTSIRIGSYIRLYVTY